MACGLQFETPALEGLCTGVDANAAPHRFGAQHTPYSGGQPRWKGTLSPGSQVKIGKGIPILGAQSKWATSQPHNLMFLQVDYRSPHPGYAQTSVGHIRDRSSICTDHSALTLPVPEVPGPGRLQAGQKTQFPVEEGAPLDLRSKYCAGGLRCQATSSRAPWGRVSRLHSVCFD